MDDAFAFKVPRLEVRHRKRGSTYFVLGRAQLQTDAPLSDNAELVIYVSESGQLWARAAAEFDDDRFELVEVVR